MARTDETSSREEARPKLVPPNPDAEAEKWARMQVREERDFYSHLASFAGVIGLLFVIDLATGDGWWFYWPMLGWGVAVAIHAFEVFGGRRFGPAWESRRISNLLGSSSKRDRSSVQRTAPLTSELQRVIVRAQVEVELMRSSAERITREDVRLRAIGVCDRAENIVRALAEPRRDEFLAREFVDQVLDPAATLFEQYARLSQRGIASAGPALQRFETTDLATLERTLDDVQERLYQGDLVSLEVASEMLNSSRSGGVHSAAGIGEVQ